MRQLGMILTLMGMLVVGQGCSQETVDDTKEAGQAIGEAAESAAKDTAENTEKAAKSVKDSLDKDD